MPPLDAIHEAVKHALEKDGWVITADPQIIRFAELTLLADLAAERPFTAERSGNRIVVEVKTFSGKSAFQEFKLALGQYLIYRTFLEMIEPGVKLYLAVPRDVYRRFFLQVAIQVIVRRFEVGLVVVDVPSETVALWTS
jgi:hypothetical protein